MATATLCSLAPLSLSGVTDIVYSTEPPLWTIIRLLAFAILVVIQGGKTWSHPSLTPTASAMGIEVPTDF